MRGLYVHVPFCARACPYCDFDFEVGRRPAIDRYLAGLAAEIEGRELAGAFDTIYVGGGTPSLLGAAGLVRLIAALRGRFPGSGAVEVTVEVNPEHVDDAVVDALIAAGVGRISLGVQTLDPAGLRCLGRAHAPAEAEAAIARAAGRGLRVSADLIVGWPGQGAPSLVADVDRILAAGAEHASIYALTVETGSPWPRLVRRGLRVLPDADHQAEMLTLAESTLVAHGLRHYEVASYARPGAEARHNLLYWRFHDYVGLGPSAHSATYAADGAVIRRGNPRGLDLWAEGGAAEIEALDPIEGAIEGLWVGLRVLDGLSIAEYLGRFPAVDRAWVDRRIARQIALGNLEWAPEVADVALVGHRGVAGASPPGGAPERGAGASAPVLRVAPGRWLWHDAVASDLLGPA